MFPPRLHVLSWDYKKPLTNGPSGRGTGSSNFRLDDHAFAMKIAVALKSEMKDRNSRAKLVASWTGAIERTVKNWILGRYAPSGRHLVILAQHSDQAKRRSVDGRPAGFAFGRKGRGP